MQIMANIVGKVALLQGQAVARGADGSQRALKVGDVVYEGEVIVTAANSRVELALEGGNTFLLRAKETVTLDKAVIGNELPEARDAALLDRVTETAEITRAIAQGSSLDELLEETAAGLSGGPASDGHGFVELLRIVEAVPPLAYEFGTGRGYVPPELVGGQGRPDAPLPVSNASPPSVGTTNQAPAANVDSGPVTEDTAAVGNVLGNDTDADGNPLSVVSFTVAGVAGTFVAGATANVPGVGTLQINPDGSYTFTPAPDYNGPVPA
jgi:hypothetical protein